MPNMGPEAREQRQAGDGWEVGGPGAGPAPHCWAPLGVTVISSLANKGEHAPQGKPIGLKCELQCWLPAHLPVKLPAFPLLLSVWS